MLNTLNPLANNEQANQPLCIKDALIDRPVTGIGRFLRDRPVSNIQILSLSFHFYFILTVSACLAWLEMWQMREETD